MKLYTPDDDAHLYNELGIINIVVCVCYLFQYL